MSDSHHLDSQITISKPEDMLKKKYEEMSFEEMSQHLAESNRQLSELLTISMSSSQSASTLDSIITEEQDKEKEESDDINDDALHKKYTRLFTRAASNGDLAKVKELLSDEITRSYIDINARDSDGTPPLIYAACFGKTDIAQVLIEYGAIVDAQDSFGWSALMWATNNSHEALVKILLESGASATTKSAKGRTVFDFVNTENQKMVDILSTNNPRDSVSSTSSLFFRTTSSVSSNSSSSDNNDFYYQQYNDDNLEEAELRKKLFESTMALALEGCEQSDSEDDVEGGDHHSDNEDDTEEDFLDNEFHWDKCSPDQMFVFNSDDLNYILDTVITYIKLPLENQQDIHVPSNVIFLSARFAHYFSSNELLNQVLEGASNRISKAVKMNARNVHILAFWISNLTRLLFYLKKDTGLVVVTAEQQLNLSELISETYNMMIGDTEKRLLKVLSPAMLEHEEIPELGAVDFTDDWHRFFRSSRRSTDSSSNQAASIIHHNSSSISPQSITSLLSSTLFVLQSYDVHPIIIIQALAQFFHFISCELFNRILTNKKLLCRSKAMQVRMNFSHLEDWISVNKLPNHLLGYLNPTIQLLQLLQCITQLKDLVDFINTSKKFDALNAPQIKRCVISYRYEVNEERIPEEIEKYAMQCAEDTVRRHNKQQKRRTGASSVALSRTASMTSSNSSRRTSISQFITRSVPSTPISEQLPTILPDTKEEEQEDHDNDEEEVDDTKEIKDTRFMLPFSVPTTAHMVSFNHWDHHKQEDHQRPIIPIIPEEWMDKLDKPTTVNIAV